MDISNLIIREETEADIKDIFNINKEAFKRELEGSIVDKVRDAKEEHISLVAELNNKVVGHIFYSLVTADNFPQIKGGMGLAPLAVLPEFQKQGIGTKLMEGSIKILKEKKTPFVLVFGHGSYYPKFGYERASKYNIKPEFEGVPDEAFMILILDKEAMKNVDGVFKMLPVWKEE